MRRCIRTLWWFWYCFMVLTYYTFLCTWAVNVSFTSGLSAILTKNITIQTAILKSQKDIAIHYSSTFSQFSFSIQLDCRWWQIYVFFFFFQLANHEHFVIACISIKRPLFVSFWFKLISKIKIVFNVFWPRKYCYRVLQLVATESIAMSNSTSCAWCRHNMPHPPVTLTLKMVSKSHVTWATSLPILVFLGLSVLELGPMYATDRQMSDSIIA